MVHLEELIGYDANHKAQKKLLVDTQDDLDGRQDLGLSSIALVRSVESGSRVKILTESGWEVL